MADPGGGQPDPDPAGPRLGQLDAGDLQWGTDGGRTAARTIFSAPGTGGLGLEVFGEPVRAQFAAHPGLLVTAEGRKGVEASAVDVDLTGLQPPGERGGLGVVARPDGTGESVHGAVRDAQGVLLVLVAQDAEHGTEDLLLGDRHLGATSAKTVGRTKKPRSRGIRGRPRSGALLLDALVDVTPHPFLLPGVHHRTDAVAVLRAAAASSSASSYCSRCTSILVQALHVWPELDIRWPRRRSRPWRGPRSAG